MDGRTALDTMGIVPGRGILGLRQTDGRRLGRRQYLCEVSCMYSDSGESTVGEVPTVLIQQKTIPRIPHIMQ